MGGASGVPGVNSRLPHLHPAAAQPSRLASPRQAFSFLFFFLFLSRTRTLGEQGKARESQEGPVFALHFPPPPAQPQAGHEQALESQA